MGDQILRVLGQRRYALCELCTIYGRERNNTLRKRSAVFAGAYIERLQYMITDVTNVSYCGEKIHAFIGENVLFT